MINKVTLIGNLGKDPEVRKLESGAVVAKFSVATNESYLDKASNEWRKLTEWHNVVAWRGLAEYAERNFQKGKLVYVEGKLTTRKWTDNDGKDRYVTEVVARMLRALDRKEADDMAMQGETTTKATNTESAAASQMLEDDLPF